MRDQSYETLKVMKWALLWKSQNIVCGTNDCIEKHIILKGFLLWKSELFIAMFFRYLDVGDTATEAAVSPTSKHKYNRLNNF